MTEIIYNHFFFTARLFFFLLDRRNSNVSDFFHFFWLARFFQLFHFSDCGQEDLIEPITKKTSYNNARIYNCQEEVFSEETAVYWGGTNLTGW